MALYPSVFFPRQIRPSGNLEGWSLLQGLAVGVKWKEKGARRRFQLLCEPSQPLVSCSQSASGALLPFVNGVPCVCVCMREDESRKWIFISSPFAWAAREGWGVERNMEREGKGNFGERRTEGSKSFRLWGGVAEGEC
ncbi:hypothetical protein CDAR_441061 [Caerostris darwini]|uniref:Uncharacterized protein n=1 Tax=Caerostris darwini TaxID=1538125 RepID=A0AAV4Q7J4_9ARAC|nr:hypothetical protein CDAR_441061 [Caerostris darwini]